MMSLKRVLKPSSWDSYGVYLYKILCEVCVFNRWWNRKDTLLLRKNESNIFYNTPLMPCMCENSLLSEHVPFARDRQTLISESAQVMSQHLVDKLCVSLCCECCSWGSHRAAFNTSHTSAADCWALTNSAVLNPARSFASRWDVFSCSLQHRLLLHSQHISAVKLPQEKMQHIEISWEKKFKKQGEKMGKRRSEEIRGKRRNQPSHSSFSTPSILDTLSCRSFL